MIDLETSQTSQPRTRTGADRVAVLCEVVGGNESVETGFEAVDCLVMEGAEGGVLSGELDRFVLPRPGPRCEQSVCTICDFSDRRKHETTVIFRDVGASVTVTCLSTLKSGRCRKCDRGVGNSQAQI
jgi:hypothetical protein